MMLRRNDRNLENIPVGALGLIALDGCTEMGTKVNDYLVKWRKEDGHVQKNDIAFTGYEKDTYLIDAKVPRFGSGEAKGIINESVRGKDLYLMVDVCNYSLTYSLTGNVNHMSPDDHFQNLKRIIAAVGGKGRRINVIMPFLYESRQHKRQHAYDYFFSGHHQRIGRGRRTVYSGKSGRFEAGLPRSDSAGLSGNGRNGFRKILLGF